MLRIIYVDHGNLLVLASRLLEDQAVPAPGEKVSLLGANFTVHSYTILTGKGGLVATVLVIPPTKDEWANVPATVLASTDVPAA